MVKQTRGPISQSANGTSGGMGDYIGEGDDHTLAFDVQDTVDLQVSGLDLIGSQTRSPNGQYQEIQTQTLIRLIVSGAGSSFRTDTEISGNLNLKERELQRWEPGPETDVDLTLGGDAPGAWDQFAANEKLYNVRSDYDEELYTTSIDRTNPAYQQLERKAEKLAREMEREGEAKRQGADADAGLDEEDKYEQLFH